MPCTNLVSGNIEVNMTAKFPVHIELAFYWQRRQITIKEISKKHERYLVIIHAMQKTGF